MRRILIALLVVAAVSLSGCIANVTPFGNYADIQKVDLQSKFKTGESCAWVVLMLFGPFGDVSVVKAAQASGIHKADIIDYRIENYLVAQRQCALVYGK